MERRDFIKTSILAGVAGSTSYSPFPTSDRAMFDKIWEAHVVANLGGDTDLLHVDRHPIHDLHAGVFEGIARRGFDIRSPELTFAVADHSVSTLPDRTLDSSPTGRRLAGRLVDDARELGIETFGIDDPGQGIVHKKICILLILLNQ